MSEARKRVYRSELREEQARVTRRRVVDAAADLFTERGFAATTIDAVADAAGVSRKTVFTAVGGKVELLKLAYDYATAGDDEPLTMAERPALQEVMTLARTDPRAAFRLWAGFVTEVGGRIGALHLALRAAAEVDPEAEALFRRWEQQRVDTMRAGPVAHLEAADLLRPEVSPGEAAAILSLLVDPALYQQLVVDNGWPAERFHVWLARTLVEQVIRPEP